MGTDFGEVSAYTNLLYFIDEGEKVGRAEEKKENNNGIYFSMRGNFHGS